MSKTEEKPKSLEELKMLFLDEDTETWMDAARRIGKRADEEALEFIIEHLKNTGDIHSMRHAWCALGAYLCATDPEHDPPVRVRLKNAGAQGAEDRKARKGKGKKKKQGSLKRGTFERKARTLVGELLEAVAIEHLADTKTPLSRLASFPGFKTQRRRKIEELEAALESKTEQFEQKEQAKQELSRSVEALDAALELWSKDSTPVNQIEQLELSKHGGPSIDLGAVVPKPFHDTDTPLSELSSLQGFDDLRERSVEELKVTRRDRMGLLQQSEGPWRGLSNHCRDLDQAIRLWRDDATTMRQLSRLTRQEGRLRPQLQLPDEWSFGSLMAGVSFSVFERLVIELPLMVAALADRASRGGDNIAYVKQLPRILEEIPKERRTDELKEEIDQVLEILAGKMPAPMDGGVHWVDYVLGLQEMADNWSLELELPPGRGLECVEPAEVKQQYQAWRSRPTERSAMALARACEARFRDALTWDELPDERKLALAVFHRALVDPSGEGRPHGAGLEHRLRYLRQTIDTWKDHNSAIFVVLVRTWKVLLNQELLGAAKKGGVQTIYRRQLRWIHPLVARWDLSSVAQKDLATIAARVLCDCYETCVPLSQDEREALGLENTQHLVPTVGDPTVVGRLDDFDELLYGLMYALPELHMLREMTLFAAKEPRVAKILGDIKAVVDAKNKGQGAGDEGFLKSIWEMKTSNEEETSDIPSQEDVNELVELLGDPARHWKVTHDEKPNWKKALTWMVKLRQRTRLREVAGVSGNGGPMFRDELKVQVETATGAVAGEFDRLVKEVVRLQSALNEPSADADVVEVLRELIDGLRTLHKLAREHLPLAERSEVSRGLENQLSDYEQRYEFLCKVLECENEALALTAMGLQDPDFGEHQPRRKKSSYKAKDKDLNLLLRWFIDRHMLRELSGQSAVLRFLTSPVAVALWIVAPYVFCFLLNRAATCPKGASCWYLAVPFILSALTGMVLLGLYLSGRLDRPGTGDEQDTRLEFKARHRASALIPHMVGALFLGIMERFAADENWSLAFESDPIIRLANIAIFLLATVFFVRFVVLRNQMPLDRTKPGAKGDAAPLRKAEEKEDENVFPQKKILRRRTLSLLAMGFWLSFLFITIYSILMGKVMAGRTGITKFDPESLGSLARTLNNAIPLHIHAQPLPDLHIYVFPWAILTWTVQLFFFSAIFERIVNRSS